MIYVQYRRVDPFGITWGGAGSVLVNYTTRTGKYISNASVSYLGSGVTGVDGADMPLDAVVGLFRHEYCHYSLGYHKPYSTIAGGSSFEAAGYELGFAPMDMIAVGYDNIINFSGSTMAYDIGDLHSTGDIVKITTGTSGEYFYISNRRRIVGDGNGKIYDCNMAGDTAMGAPFLQFHDYSKGLYIYHVSNGDGFDYWSDLECADGLWDWEVDHYNTPDWSSSQYLPFFVTTGVGYADDDPYTSTGRMVSRDGHSVFGSSNAKWFSLGKRHQSLGQQGIDRIFTNLEEDRCSRDCMGDRWDAWAIDYNQVFSPYSSPNTNDRNNNQTGIFIYYVGFDVNTNYAALNIYKTGVGGFDEDSILEVTPPSKPMGLTVTMTECLSGKSFPVLTWKRNLEPDMDLYNVPPDVQQRFRIYRATSDIEDVPTEYVQIAEENFNVLQDPSFIDYNAYAGCDGGMIQYNYQVRYRVQAIDVYLDRSVLSDFDAVPITLYQSPGGDLAINPNNSPVTFSLSQNYPNPFNPFTEIRYNLAYNTFVSIKIYNVLGEEVAVLVNEYGTKGSHTAIFDGTNLPSGIYLYRIEAGTFIDAKKMVLVK
jgi:hypothetical protein